MPADKRVKFPDLLAPFERGLQAGEESILTVVTATAVMVEEVQRLIVAPTWEFYTAAQARRKRIEAEVRPPMLKTIAKSQLEV